MPGDNPDLVRQAYAAWNSGNLEAAFGFLDPEIEVVTPPNLPESGTIRGADAVRRWAADFLEAWKVIGAEPERFIDAGDQVVVIVRYFGQGKESGLDVRGANIDAHVWTLRNRKAVKFHMYQGTAEALHDAGVESEEATKARTAPRISSSDS